MIDLENLSQKIRSVFGSATIDKRRLHASQLLKRGIPGYVAEWVVDTVAPGEGPLTPAEVEKIQAWATRAIPGPDDHNLIKARLIAGETLKALTPLQVDVILTRHRQDQLGKLSLLGINDAIVSEDILRKYPELLRGGMWGIVQLMNTGNGVGIISFKPMEATVDMNIWRSARAAFTLEEWRALLLVSLGYNPNAFSVKAIDLLLCRLLPLVQKNMHLIELAPKGTGKSFVYENISPRVRLVSGGNVSPAVLFVNNANSVPGILARYSVVVLDEVQTLKFEKPQEIVGGLKGYLANGQLTRGGMHQLASDCGLVLLANILLDDQQKPVNSPIIRELPSFLQETAFLDRIKGIIPGWEIPKLSGNSFAASIGLKSDFFGNALLALREELFLDQVCHERICLGGKRTYKRNEDAVRAIATGLTKIYFPDGKFTEAEFHYYCIEPALRLRSYVWNQLYSLDAEYRQFDWELQCIISSCRN